MTTMTNEITNYNIRVRGLTRHLDNILNTLASLRGVHKYELIREALEEYVNRHKHEIADTVIHGTKPVGIFFDEFKVKE